MSTAKTPQSKKNGTRRRVTKAAGTKKAGTKKPERNTIESLMKRAENGDVTALAALRKSPPEQIDAYLLDVYGQLGKTTEIALMKAVAGGNLLHVEGLKLKAEQLKAELAGPDASPLERLLVERVACCWILVNYADAKYVQDDGGRTWVADEYLQKWQDRAQKRFLSACKALAQIRRLLGPNIQINVGDKQINVMPADA